MGIGFNVHLELGFAALGFPVAFGFDKPFFFFFFLFLCLEAFCSLGKNTETGNCNSLLVASSKEGLRSSF